MSCSFSLHVPKALPPLPYYSSSSSSPSLFISSKHKPFHNNTTPPSNQLKIVKCSSSQKPNDHVTLKKPNLALPIGAALLALVRFSPYYSFKYIEVLNCVSKFWWWLYLYKQAEHPAASLAVTGANNHPQELSWILIQLGIVFFFYFLTAPVSFNLFHTLWGLHQWEYNSWIILLQPLILYWLYKRWYRRKLVEMYFQFMCVFIFFPA